MKNTVSICLFMALAAAGMAGGPYAPFPVHATYAAGHIKPTNATQAVMDQETRDYYDAWKAAYVQAGCSAGHYKINYDGANQTVSEAHGYGMLTVVLMAGHDAAAQTVFDGMYQYYRAHPANGFNRLMAWKQNAACANIDGPDSASDGDLDIAHSLLMADRQWGSCGAINYRAEANAILAQIKTGELNSTRRYVKLGSWATGGAYLDSTRSSDFMTDHYRTWGAMTGDPDWTGLRDQTYTIINSLQANYAPATGLLPDFITDPLGTPDPAPGGFLEDAGDSNYDYNACRDPWRLATDFLVSGDSRAQVSVQRMISWAKTAPISSNPNNVRAGYLLGGTASAAWSDEAFTAPFAVGAMVDASNQAFLNSFWTYLAARNVGNNGYYGDSIKMLCYIVISGNWWAPENLADPCVVGTPTRTRTLTVTSTRSSTPTVSRTLTSTLSLTATQTQSPTRTATPSLSSSPSSTPAAPTGTGTPSRTATATATPSRTSSSTPSSTLSSTRSSTRTPSPSATSTGTPTGSRTLTLSSTLTSSPSPSSTLSLTPSITETHTPVPPGSSATSTATESPLSSFTYTRTLTASRTATPSYSRTPSPSVTLSSSATSQATATSSPTVSVSSSSTPTYTRSATPTLTPSPPDTPTATPSSTVQSSASPSHSPTASMTLSPTLSFTSVPTVAAEGPLHIKECRPYPHPNPQALFLHLEGPADKVEIRLYSNGRSLMRVLESGPLALGWAQVPLPADLVKAMPAGSCHYRIQAQRGHEKSEAKVGTLVFLP